MTCLASCCRPNLLNNLLRYSPQFRLRKKHVEWTINTTCTSPQTSSSHSGCLLYTCQLRAHNFFLPVRSHDLYPSNSNTIILDLKHLQALAHQYQCSDQPTIVSTLGSASNIDQGETKLHELHQSSTHQFGVGKDECRAKKKCLCDSAS